MNNRGRSNVDSSNINKNDISLIKNLIKQMILSEIHYKDILSSRGWQLFFDKYGSKEKVERLGYNLDDLYVNFDFRGDFDNKKIYGLAKYEDMISHYDPPGVYTFKLKRVIENPLNLGGGFESRYKYLRVIQRIGGKNSLLVNNNNNNNVKFIKDGQLDLLKITKSDIPILRNMFLSAAEIDPIYEVIFGNHRSEEEINNFLVNYSNLNHSSANKNRNNSYGFAFYELIRKKIENTKKNIEEINYLCKDKNIITSLDFEYRDNNEQYRIYKKMGIDSVLDRGKKHQIIFRKEIDQAFFMNRSKFKIIDIFDIKQDNRIYHLHMEKYISQISEDLFGNNSIISINKNNKKFLSFISNIKDGHRIELNLENAYNTLYRTGKTYKNYYFMVSISNDNDQNFKIEYQSYPGQKISSIINELKKMINDYKKKKSAGGL
jgi:hypothetical protein